MDCRWCLPVGFGFGLTHGYEVFSQCDGGADSQSDVDGWANCALRDGVDGRQESAENCHAASRSASTARLWPFWSNFYLKPATALLPAVSSAHAADWVAVSWPAAQTFDTLTAYFATETRTATTITFDRVNTTRVRLELTSPAPDTTTTGFLQLAELDVIGTAVASDP